MQSGSGYGCDQHTEVAPSVLGLTVQTIIISFPVLVATSAILYRRGVSIGLCSWITELTVSAYLGEQQRRIPHDVNDVAAHAKDKIAGEIGSAPWVVHEKAERGV